MTKRNADWKELKEGISTKISANADFENALKALLDDPNDENLDQINLVRASFVESSAAMEDIIAKLQSLSKSLREPSQDDLSCVADIIFLGRQMLHRSISIIHSHKPLWHKGVIIAETSDLIEVTDYLAEVLDDIEVAFLKGA